MTVSQGALAGVAGSFHDLSTQTGNTDEVCVFCHTPHGAATAAAVPLWNKVLSDPTIYTRYSSLNGTTLDGAEADVGSVSLACLSCHDGTQAMDVVLNAPGSGAYNAAGIEIDAGAIGNMGSPPVRSLETDLTDDHPISIQYAGGGCVGTDTDGASPCTTLGDADFNQPVKTTINAIPIWWVDSSAGTTGVRESTDMQLYTRFETGFDASGEPFVECGSCHDPHNDATAGIGSVAFLRVQNTASQICTACHVK